MKYRKILSLDQALNLTGFAIFEEDLLIKYGTLNLSDIKGDNPTDEKILNVKEFIKRIKKNYGIDLVIIEDIQSQVNIKTFKHLAWLQGVIKNYLYEQEIPYTVYKPSEWRKIIGIKGRKRVEQKANAQLKVKELYNIDVSEDEADAILLAVATITSVKKNNLNILKDN